MTRIGLDTEKMEVDLAAEASVRGIPQEGWTIAIGDDFLTALEMILDEVESRGCTRSDATVHIVPNPESADGVLLRLDKVSLWPDWEDE